MLEHWSVLTAGGVRSEVVCRVDLGADLDGLVDPGAGLLHGHPVELAAVAEAEGDRVLGDILLAGNQDEWSLGLGCVADLLAEAINLLTIFSIFFIC